MTSTEGSWQLAATGSGQRQEHLRALFINDTSRNGGPGRTILDILKHLDPVRVHRTVVLPREGIVSRSLREASVADELLILPGFIENLFEPLSREISRDDLTAPLHLKVLRASANVFRAATGLARLVGFVRRRRFDVVFCNGTMANFVGGVIAAATGVPVIWHVIYPTVPKVLRRLHLLLARGSNVCAILCVSRAVVGQFSSCAGKVRVVADALDVDEFRIDSITPVLRKEFGLSESVVIFGSHGRILRRKGFVELIQAARIVFDKLGAEDFCRFVVLGDTPEDLRPDHLLECRSLVRKLGLEDRVHFPGFRSDVRAYLADFDVAIVPSVYEDPLPRSVLESMAMAKPVIAFDVGGIGEMVTTGRDGILVSGRPPDIEGLADACLTYLRDKERRRADGMAARLRVEQDFNAERHGRAVQDLLLAVRERTSRR